MDDSPNQPDNFMGARDFAFVEEMWNEISV